MKKLTLLQKAIPTFSALALLLAAGAPSSYAGEGPKKHGPCSELELSSAQKQEMKEAHFKFAEKKIDLKAAKERAQLNFMKVVSDKDSSESDIRKAADELSVTKSKLMAVKEASHIDFLTKILKPEQREKALRCEMFMRHKKHEHHERAERD
jgi:hypothetical protein